MVIDFHVHGKLTKKFPFDEEGFLKKVEEAKKEGLDSFALTEHSHAKNFIEAYEFLEEHFEYRDHYYDVNGVKVFTGVEVTTKEKLDILLIGERKKILSLNYEILKQTGEKELIGINDLFQLVNHEELLVIVAHPYRKHEVFPELSQEILNKIDAIEFNAKDLGNYGIEKMMEKVKKLGEELNRPITGGSDTHYFLQMGSIKNQFNMDCNTIQELKKQIQLRNDEIEISNELTIRVRASKIIKDLIKNYQ